jgi:zinc protease
LRTPDEEIEDAKATTLDAAKAFYTKFFGASNGELVVVGDFDPTELRILAGKLFGDWNSPAQYARVVRSYAPADFVNRLIETPDKANAMFAATLPIKFSDEHPDHAALTLATYMLGGNSNSRLYKRIRTKEGLSYGVGARLIAPAKEDSGSFDAFAIAAPSNVPKVEAAFKEEIERVLKEGFTEEEVATAKKGWIQAQTVSRSQDQELMMLLGANADLGRTMTFQAELEKKVQALTFQEVNDALRRHMDPSKISYFKAGDFKKAAGVP